MLGSYNDTKPDSADIYVSHATSPPRADLPTAKSKRRRKLRSPLEDKTIRKAASAEIFAIPLEVTGGPDQ